MSHMGENPDENSELQSTESMLKQLMPAPSALNERELFYRAGYAARHGTLPTTTTVPSSIAKRAKLTNRTWLLSFSGGAISGIAACILLFFGLNSAATTSQEGYRDSAIALQAPTARADIAPEDIAPVDSGAGESEAVATRPMLNLAGTELDWNENAIRSVIYRGNRRAMWQERGIGPNANASVTSQESESVSMEMNNLSWRRVNSEDWLN